MKTVSLLIALSISSIVFCQYGEANFLYSRVRFAEQSIGFEKKIYDHLGFAAEVGYRHRFTKEAYEPQGLILYPFRLYWKNRAYRGISVRPFILNFHVSEEVTHSISTSYQFLSADKLIYDPGKFGGSNTSDYAVYGEQKHALGISYLFGKQLSWLPQVSWYFELGVHYNLFEKRYIKEGTYSAQLPSNKVETGQSMGVNSHVGLKVDFLRKW